MSHRVGICERCGREKRIQAFGLRMGCYKAERRQDPEYAEHDREFSRRYKATHRKELAEYSRRYHATHKGTCSECGGPIGRKHDGGVCEPCRDAAIHERRLAICVMWADGLTLREIAEFLGWTVDHLQTEIYRARGDGYDLPYRRSPKARTAIRSALVAA